MTKNQIVGSPGGTHGIVAESGQEAHPVPAGRLSFLRFAGPALTALGLVLVVLGLVGGGASAVWQRAALICYECIGIG